MVDRPALYDQRTAPVFGSSAVASPPFWNRTEVLPWALNTSGVTQLISFLRLVFHRFLPVFVSRPARNESPALSIGTNSTPSASTGELAMPTWLVIFG
jgi:hypothetical protein